MEEKLKREKQRASGSQLNSLKSDGDWEIVESDQFQGTREEIFSSLEEYLRNQLKIATANSQNFTSTGDASNAAK